MEQKFREAAQQMFDSTLIAYFGTVAGRLALDPNSRELILEHRALGDELQDRLSR